MALTASINRGIKYRGFGTLVGIGLNRFIGLSTANFRLLPDFLVIGAQRAGTTSFFNYLIQHPQVSPSIPKEVHYFSNNFQKGVNWYRSHFPLSRHKPNSRKSPETNFLSGEATPYYLTHPLAPQRAKQVTPKARIITLLRNPVDRAYSHYHHEVRLGIENLSFEEAIDLEEKRLDNEVKKLVEDDTYLSFNLQHFSYLYRGKYSAQITAWRKFFPDAKILILSSETFFEHPQKTMQLAIEFLGLPDFTLTNIKKFNASPYPQMNKATRDRLINYFKLHNAELYENTGRDFGWDK